MSDELSELEKRVFKRVDPEPIQHIEIINGRAKLRHLKAIYVANLYVVGGASVEEVMEQYDISRAEVHAALTYYYDNEDAITQLFDDIEEYSRRVGTSSEELAEKTRARRENETER